MSSQEKPRYVRFGSLPAGRGRRGHSRNPLAGERLEGVSVYPGRLEGGGALFRIDGSRLNDQGCGALVAMAAADRPAFFVEGEEVGSGPDGEPLLRTSRAWPVPETTRITSYALFSQPALALWSSGPRDGSGEKLLQWRLSYPEAGYMPPGTIRAAIENPHAHNARRKKKPAARKQLRRQKRARKEQRARKR